MVERDVARLGLLIDQHGMALRERAALAVLTGETNRQALVEQRGESERLAGRPIDAVPRHHGGATIVEKALDRLMNAEAFGNRRYALGERPEFVGVHSRLAAPLVVGDVSGRLHARPPAVQPIRLVRDVALARLVFRFQPLPPIAPRLIDFALGDDALPDQLL